MITECIAGHHWVAYAGVTQMNKTAIAYANAHLKIKTWALCWPDFERLCGVCARPGRVFTLASMLLPRRTAIILRRSLLIGAAGMLSVAATKQPRLRPMAPPDIDAAQQRLYDTIVDTRVDIVGKVVLFDERGALRGPWNAEVASPALGQHLERLATAVRSENSLEPRLYEVAVLVVGVHWQAQFEWYAHERFARKAGVAEAAFPLMKEGAPPAALEGILQPDEVAVRYMGRVHAECIAECLLDASASCVHQVRLAPQMHMHMLHMHMCMCMCTARWPCTSWRRSYSRPDASPPPPSPRQSRKYSNAARCTLTAH